MKTPEAKKAFALTIVVGGLLGIWVWSSQPGTEDTKESSAQVTRGLASAEEPAKAKMAPTNGEPVKVGPTAVPTKTGLRFQWSPQAKAAVEEFGDLSEKVFSSPAEQQRRSELLRNPEYLQNIGDYLLNVPREEVQAPIYDQSIDFLIEALKLGSTEALTQVERVISDPQVENSQLPLEQRKFLGETKGELLYQYAAVDSVNKTEQQINTLIPGPVTQKIWNQVSRELEANLSESKRELAEAR